MARKPPSSVNPCPSCGVALKVHADRVGQKMQCPKCLAVFVFGDEPSSGAAVPSAGGGEAIAGAGDRTALEERLARMEDCLDHLRRERRRWAERTRQTAEEYGLLAERFERLVAAHQALVDDYVEAVARCRAGGPAAPEASSAGEPPGVAAGSGSGPRGAR